VHPRIAARALQPTRILDVGFGFGEYGLLPREYLDIYGAPNRPHACSPPWRTTIDGIEGCADYVQDLQRAIYDHIYIGDALDVLRGMADSAYDLVLIVDMLEHLGAEAARGLLREATRVGTDVLLATPSRFTPQGAAWGNDLEAHRSYWRPRDLKSVAPCTVISRVLQGLRAMCAPSTLAILSKTHSPGRRNLSVLGILKRELPSVWCAQRTSDHGR